MPKHSIEDQAFFTDLVEKFGPELLSQDEEYVVINHSDGRQTLLHKWRKLPIAKDGKIVGSIPIEDRIVKLLQS